MSPLPATRPVAWRSNSCCISCSNAFSCRLNPLHTESGRGLVSCRGGSKSKLPSCAVLAAMRPRERLVSEPAGDRLLTMELAIGGGGPRNMGLLRDFDGEPPELGVLLLHPSVDTSRYMSGRVRCREADGGGCWSSAGYSGRGSSSLSWYSLGERMGEFRKVGIGERILGLMARSRLDGDDMLGAGVTEVAVNRNKCIASQMRKCLHHQSPPQLRPPTDYDLK